ncbi:hypothetical protein ACT4R0_05710 [Ornithobacterium rhinotracheale]|uniref:hypothetical protein n=1 Tax=Ornithobacterium rhinotracheale TaxID=28251 RepID=UPI0040364A34
MLNHSNENTPIVNNSNEVQKSKGELLMEWADLLDDPEQMAQDLESFLNVVIHLFLEEKECQMYRESISYGRFYILEMCNVLKKKNSTPKDFEYWIFSAGGEDFVRTQLQKFLDNVISIYLNNKDSYTQQQAICEGRFYLMELINVLK